MNETEFWELIDKSNQQCRDDKHCQLEFIKSSLIEMDSIHIYDFEEILRQKIIECDDYKVMAAAKIIDGYVSDDSYIYFRCWLIGKGKFVYKSAIRDPETLSKHLIDKNSCDFEELLYVATEVYSSKTGKEEDRTFPRDTCIKKGLDYDFGAPPTKGEDWDEDDLPEMYPKLWGHINS